MNYEIELLLNFQTDNLNSGLVIVSPKIP